MQKKKETALLMSLVSPWESNSMLLWNTFSWRILSFWTRTCSMLFWYSPCSVFSSRLQLPKA